MKIYYLHFKPNADVNYLHLFSLYDLADYNPATKAYDTINYTSITEETSWSNSPSRPAKNSIYSFSLSNLRISISSRFSIRRGSSMIR